MAVTLDLPPSRVLNEREPVARVLTAPQQFCLSCGGPLWISQHRERTIRLLDETLEVTLPDKKCFNPACPTPSLRFRSPEECTLALPRGEFGLDVVMAVGSMRFRDDFSFPRIHARLRERGVPISPMAVQYQLRYYLSLVNCQVGIENGKLRRRLLQQGAILPVIDGVQFGEGDPVLYLIVDVLSRRRREAPQRGRGAYLRRFIEHMQKVTRSYAKGLFHCYDDPRIPQTTNDLEGLNGAAKHNLRRCAGRSSTANGPGSSSGPAYMFAVALNAFMPAAQIDELLGDAIDPMRYRESRRLLDEVRAPQARRRSLLRAPDKRLAEILAHWRGP